MSAALQPRSPCKLLVKLQDPGHNLRGPGGLVLAALPLRSPGPDYGTLGSSYGGLPALGLAALPLRRPGSDCKSLVP